MSVTALPLRSRLLAGIAFVAVVLAIVSVVVTVSTRAQLIDQVDERLTSFSPGSRLNGSGRAPNVDLSEVLPPATDSTFPAEPPGGFGVRVSDVYQGIVDVDGELITIFTPNLADTDYGPPDIDTGDLSSELPTIITVGAADGSATYRVLLQPFGELIGITGVPIDDVQATITRLIWVEVLGSLAILAALSVVAWWVVHLGIRPIQTMTATASRIAGGDLGVRVPESAPGTESGELATALNQMLGRIETAVSERAMSEERLRRFVSDASHELRTPVTTIRGYAELYRRGALADTAAIDDAMRRTEQEATRIGRLVDDMLALARYDEQRPIASGDVDLASLVLDAAADARATAPGRSVSTEVEDQPALVVGDEDRLRQVIANVVSNALVHTPDDSAVTLRVHTDPRRVVVEIADAGPGMEPDVAARATERFFRADPARSRHRGGSGLGLAIVDAAVAAHGGQVAIDSARGDGTTVRLTFPRAHPV